MLILVPITLRFFSSTLETSHFPRIGYLSFSALRLTPSRLMEVSDLNWKED